MKMKQKPAIFFALILLSCSAGCDQIKALTDKFFPNNKDAESKAAAPLSSSTSSQTEINRTTTKPLAGDVLAQVGSWTITKDEFKQRLNSLKDVVPDLDITNQDSKKLVLEELIRQQLLVMDAEAKDVGSKKEIADAVSEFRRTLLVREVANQLIDNIKVTDTEAQDYFNQNKEAFVEPTEYKLREIVVYTQNGAKEILIELLKGSDFAEMAKTRSKSKSAPKGGDLGFVKELPAFMANSVSTLEPGDLSTVFKGPEGYYIVKLEEKKGGKQLIFADIKNDITAGLKQMKQQDAVLSYIDQLKKKTSVKVNEALLEE